MNRIAASHGRKHRNVASCSSRLSYVAFHPEHASFTMLLETSRSGNWMERRIAWSEALAETSVFDTATKKMGQRGSCNSAAAIGPSSTFVSRQKIKSNTGSSRVLQALKAFRKGGSPRGSSSFFKRVQVERCYYDKYYLWDVPTRIYAPSFRREQPGSPLTDIYRFHL